MLEDQSLTQDIGGNRQQQGFSKKRRDISMQQKGSNESQRNSLVRHNSNNSTRSNDEQSRNNSMPGNTSHLQEKNNPVVRSLPVAAQKKKDDHQDLSTRRGSWFQQGRRSPQARMSALAPDDDSNTVVAVRAADEVSKWSGATTAVTRRPREWHRSTQEPSSASGSRLFGATRVSTSPANNRPQESTIISARHVTESLALTTPVPEHIRLLAGTMAATYRQRYRSSDITMNYNQMTVPPAHAPVPLEQNGRRQGGAMSNTHMSVAVAHSPAAVGSQSEESRTPPYIFSSQRSAWYSSSGTVRDRSQTLTSSPGTQIAGPTTNDCSLKCSHCSGIFNDQQTLKTHLQHHTGKINSEILRMTKEENEAKSWQ